MMAVGAMHNTSFPSSISRPELLSGLSLKTLGNVGNVFLSVLISFACFTTAVSIIVGTSDFFKGLFNNSHKVYVITALISSVIGVLMGQFDVHYIINVALPALMFIYPITIVLILLNVLPKRFASSLVFKAVVLVTFVFSIPDFLGYLIKADWITQLKNIIPFAKVELGWVIPSTLTFILLNLKSFKTKSHT